MRHHFNQFTGLTELALTLLVLCSCFLAIAVDVSADSGSRTGYTSGQALSVYGGAGENIGATPDDPSNAGSLLNSVNLYTGQHQESFPLVSLPGRGGIGASLSLDYNGNVSDFVRKENRKAQAGPFGLGFELGVPKIVADHRNTTDVFDDYYVLQEGKSSMRLFYLKDSSFITEQASPWKIYRHLAEVGGTQMVIGWTIMREDGTVYRYGDMEDSVQYWNATGWILKYGRFVGAGIDATDSRYATSWFLKRIQDAEDLNWVEFGYLLDTAYLEVRKDSTQTENSANPYVRASYLESMITADSNRVFISYKSRSDKQTFYGLNNYEFFYEKRADEIFQINRYGDTLSRIALRHTYLDGDRGAKFSKLVLTSIIRKSGDATQSLPPTTFSYFDDPAEDWFGSIESVTSPLGATRKFVYSQVADSANWSQLHHQLVYDSLINLYDNDNWRLTLANNVAILKEQTTSYGEQTIKVFYWDGYWRDTTFEVHGSWLDQPSVSQDGYAIIPDSNSILIPQWRGGYWHIDTLENTLLREGAGKITIHPGRDCFVAVASTNSLARPTELKRAYFFHKDGDKWIDTLIYAAAGFVYEFSSVQLVGETFAVAAVDTHTAWNPDVGEMKLRYNNRLSIGRWKAGTREAIMTEYSFYDWNYSVLGNVAVTTDLVGWVGWSNLNLFIWMDIAWSDTVFTGGDNRMWDVTSTPNGLAYSYSQPDGSYPFVGFLTYDSTQFKRTYFALGGYYPAPIFLTNNALIVQYNDQDDAYLWEWNGYEWVNDSHHVLDGEWTSSTSLRHFQDSYILKAGSQLKATRYLGNSNWASWSEFTTSGSRLTATMDMFVAHALVDTGSIYLWNPYVDSTSYSEYKFDLPLVLDSNLDTLGFLYNQFSATPASFSSTQEFVYGYEAECWPDDCDSMSVVVDLFRLIDTQFVDKPTMSVVSRVELYESITDTNPRRADFVYIGGLMDPAGLLPRFCQVQASTPYFASDSTPVGYTVHFYYNNVDSNSFYDTSLFAGIPIPTDLSDAGEFGIPGGGYHLDGMEYYTYSYTIGDSPNKTQDSQRNYFSVRKIDTLWATELDDDIFRTVLDSSRTVTDSLESFSSFAYHPVTQQAVEARRRDVIVTDTTYYYVSRQIAAVDDPAVSGTAMEADNALVQVSDNQSWYFAFDTSGTAVDSTLLSHSRAEYALAGSWKPVRSYSWRDLSTKSDTLFQSDTLDASEGNWKNGTGTITATKSTTGVISSSKLDPRGVQVVGTAGNARPGEWSVFDAEYAIDFDGWRNSAGGEGMLISSESFTGHYSFELHDRGMSEDTGLVRSFDSDELVSDRYMFQAWTKSAGYPGLLASVFDGGSVCTTYFVSPGSSAEWVLMSLLVDLTPCSGFDSVQIVAFGQLGNYTSDTIAYFDDIRFFPIDATIKTNVYDSATSLAVAGAGSDNLPTRASYDEFYRTVLVSNEAGDTLSVSEFGFSEGSLGHTINESLADQVDTIISTAIAPYDQSVDYRVSVKTFSESRAYSKSQFYVNSTQIASVRCDDAIGCTTEEVDSGSVAVEGGDTLKIILMCWNDSAAPLLKGKVWYKSHGYDASDPHFVRTETYTPGQSARAAQVKFFNSLGEVVQTRSTNVLNDTTRALVSGIAERDVLGNVTKAYLPYYDVLGLTGIDDFSEFSQAVAEAEAYYDGTLAADCDSVVYRKANFSSAVKPKLLSSESPGLEWEGKTSSFAGTTFTDSNFVKSVSVDEDGISTVAIRDQWGRFSETRNSYSANESISRIQFSDRRGMDTAIYLDTLLENGSATPIRLMAMAYNDLGQEVERWKVDYGTIRMIYDQGGNLRFMQNDKRKIENTCIYYKYDEIGRKIEEGLFSEADSLMTQANADQFTFPSDTSIVDVKYRWYFDFYSGNQVIVAPGRLVRLESADTLYYRNFFYDDEAMKDSVIVRLPMTINPYKKIIHEYYEDGSLKKLSVYPKKTGSTWVVSEKREFEYYYDEAGRLSQLTKPEVGDHTYSYVEYDYDAAGKVTQKRLGVDHREWVLIDPPYFVNWDDTLQRIDYTYNALGMLTGINWPDTSTVDTAISGYGDHFGLKIEYFDETEDIYYNGRVRAITSHHSDYGDTLTEHRFMYLYDDLGSLTEANYGDTVVGEPQDRQYAYDAFGRRTTLIADSITTVSYSYWDNMAGSSRLQTFTGMGADTMRYDTLGNLVADSSRPVYLQTYDYRNLLEYARAEKNLATSPPTTLDFLYDENGQRIQKTYTYYYMDECPPDTGIGTFGAGTMGAGGGGGGEECPFSTYTELSYLYDGGVLLATFGSNGNVVNYYVNGNGERLGHYEGTSTDEFYYYLTDHLGSPRVVLADPDDTLQSPVVTSVLAYYPFGELLQSWSSNPGVIHQFTGQEKDEHSSFDYHYFGSRYYDARLGMFTSIDKASQFANGYIYGANNPIIGTDPDGNLFFLSAPFLWSLATNVAVSATTYSVTAGDWDGRDFLKAVGGAALSSTISGGLASIGKTVGHNFLYQAGSSFATSTSTNAALGNGVSWQTGLGAAFGGAISEKSFGQFRPTGNNRVFNVGAEVAFSAAKGAASAGIGALLANEFLESPIDVGAALTQGAVSGAANGVASWAKYGASLRGPSNSNEDAGLEAFLQDKGMSRPVFRTGGLIRSAYYDEPKSVGGFHDRRFGQVFILDGSLSGVWLHETVHLWQHFQMGTSAMNITANRDKAAAQRAGVNDVYKLPGTLEYQARWYEHYYSQKYQYPYVHNWVPSVTSF